MKWKNVARFGFWFCITSLYGGGILSSCNQNNDKKPAKAGTEKVYPALKYRVDTTFVTDENFNKLNGRAAAGVFFSNSNTVVIYHFETDSKNPRIQKYCDISNLNMPLTRRHETEHARKAFLTKSRAFFSDCARGRTAAYNEIMAPASEIIEAVDLQYETGAAFPNAKMFTKKAMEKITEISKPGNGQWPVNFNDTRIADVTLEYSLEYFLGQIAMGTYRTTIRRAMNKKSVKCDYVPNAECDIVGAFTFCPDFNMMGPLFTFKTKGGRADIWNAASPQVRQKVINAVDSVLNDIKQPVNTPLLINMQKNY